MNKNSRFQIVSGFILLVIFTLCLFFMLFGTGNNNQTANFYPSSAFQQVYKVLFSIAYIPFAVFCITEMLLDKKWISICGFCIGIFAVITLFGAGINGLYSNKTLSVMVQILSIGSLILLVVRFLFSLLSIQKI